ncbi:MAG: hypothetical protein ABSG13_30070 [Bryobacteraceae bacterium]|jgi:hypothetical protein
MQNATQYGDARERLQAARVSMRQVKKLLAKPSFEAADESAALLRDVEVQLGCVAAILRQNGSKPDAEIRAGVEELQNEVAQLANFFAGADKMLSGWLDAVRSRRGGYTDRGQAAPLTLVRKLSVEG